MQIIKNEVPEGSLNKTKIKKSKGDRYKEYAQKNKEAIAARRKVWYQQNKAAIKVKQTTYRKENKEAIKQRQKIANSNLTDEQKENLKIYREKNREVMRAYQRLRNSGFDEITFSMCLKIQSNKCAICLTDFAALESNKIHADHCHIRNKPRGVLCFNCNAGLGHFKDSSENLARALAYLVNPPLGLL